ncbi:AAA family ATPase [Cohnella endophytica]|uniref:AAA family ATPase n=1 Tax=Cohnella endophytica TaxID=2419778 RepID=UPI001313F979|nr:AAA family ATPase [Cohnella endophytica]
MSGFSIYLLGGFKLSIDDEELTTVISAGKARLLLAYLTLELDRPIRRKQIAFDFWPDSTEKQALSNLRKLLHDLRESVPQIDRYIEITPTFIRWREEFPVYSDVSRFERAAQGHTLNELSQAAELYQGELLQGLYEYWFEAKRELLAQSYYHALDKLITILESRREYSLALSFANKLLIRNHLREETYRLLMRLYALNKDLAGVMQTYRQLNELLQAELGIEPTKETVQLFETLCRSGGEPLAVPHGKAQLVSRIEQWKSMQDAWKQALEGRPSLLVLRGEAGIGKTRLALEFKSWAESQGIQSLFAGCYPSVRSLSYTPVTAWLRSVSLPEAAPTRLSELARLLPELSERFPDLPQPNPVQENWQLNQWYEAIEWMLLAAQPQLLILDNIQWSDAESLQFLSYLLRSDSKAKLLIIATMRTDEFPDDSVERVISELRIERKVMEIELDPFNKQETKWLLAEIVGEELANLHAAGVYTETGGNPLFIVETIREWQVGDGNGVFRLPLSAQSVIENRLCQLTLPQRRLASTIAAVGRPVLAAFMAVVLDIKAEAMLESLERLVQVKVLQEAGGGKYDFTHDRVREAAYRLNSDGRRRRCHGQIARSLIAYHQEQSEALAAEIALHYELAGMDQEAIVYYEMAALAAEKMYANESRIKYYRKLCSLLPAERILPALMKLGDALMIVGDWNEAEISYKNWLERFEYLVPLQERALCDVALGNCLRFLGKFEEARFYLERALRYFTMMEDQNGLSLVYGTIGVLYYFMADYDRSLYYLLERMELPNVGHRTKEDCRYFGFIGFLFYDQCDYIQAIHWFKRQIALATEIGDEYSVEGAMGGLALVYMELDEMDLAFDYAVAKMEISKTIGARMGFAMAIGMLGKYYHLLGACELAEICLIFSLEEAFLIKDLHITSVVLGIEGCNLMVQLRYEEAGLMIERSIRLSKQVQIPFFECEGLYFMGLLRMRQRQYDIAMENAEEALVIAKRLKRRDMQVRVLIQLIQLKTSRGRIGSAETLSQLQDMLESFPDSRDQAAIRFAMWQQDPESPERRRLALSLNVELYLKSGKQEYLDRIQEMDGAVESIQARPMPRLATEVTQRMTFSKSVLHEIDRFVNK